jgi:hypothetical protein
MPKWRRSEGGQRLGKDRKIRALRSPYLQSIILGIKMDFKSENISTPLGDICLTVHNNENNSAVFKTRIVEAAPELPEGMSIISCKLLTCQIEIVAPLSSLEIEFKVESSIQGEIETGEFLESIKFVGSGKYLTIATRDLDWLAQQTSNGLKKIQSIQYTNRGIKLFFAELQSGEKMEIFFSTAWAEYAGTDPDKLATWLATDLCLP